MPRYLSFIAVVVCGLLCLVGCAAPKVFSVDRSEEETKAYVGHIPALVFAPPEKEDWPPLLSVYNRKQQGEDTVEEAALYSLLFAVYRGEREGDEKCECAFLQLLPVVTQIEKWDRHWSLFRYRRDGDSRAVGFLYFFDFKKE